MCPPRLTPIFTPRANKTLARIVALRSTGILFRSPSAAPDGKGKRKKVWLVTAGEKDVIRRGEDGRKELREGGEMLLHLSQVRLGSQGSPKPFSFAKTRAEEAAGTESGGKEKNKNPQ